MRVERIWLKNYPDGVPSDIDMSEYASLKDIIESSCEKFRHLPAYSNMGVVMDYAKLEALSRAFGAWLQNEAGLSKGDRVAIMMPNILQYPVAVFGALRAGMVVVNVNPMYTPRELEHQLTDSGADAIVIVENFAHTLEKVVSKVSLKKIITTQIGDLLGFPKSFITNLVVKRVKKMVPAFSLPGAVSFQQALSAGAGQALNDVTLTHDDLAFLQYTGGTTGVAKGAMLSHGNMVANLLQSAWWITNNTDEGEDRVITALPLYHIFSLTANCLTFMKMGGENVLITNPRDFDGFIKELKAKPFTGFTGVNTLFNALLNHPEFKNVDFSELKLTLGGGMAVQRAVAEQWREVTGRTLVEAYGLTETSPAACINPMDNDSFNGSIGLPVPSTTVTIRDDDGNELPLGEVGEICIDGPQVMQGYWKREEATAETMTADGALRTGDMGRMDENGFTYLTDRKKDMILVSGFNVYPNELEDVLCLHDGILEAAAIGVPDEKSGEAIKVFVVLIDKALDPAAIKAHCREHMTAYKIPRIIEFRDELPKSNVGKILRRELRDAEA
ncbi:MAG: AMP-binding protein [Gammaproteobacteria bacterium]